MNLREAQTFNTQQSPVLTDCHKLVTPLQGRLGEHLARGLGCHDWFTRGLQRGLDTGGSAHHPIGIRGHTAHRQLESGGEASGRAMSGAVTRVWEKW